MKKFILLAISIATLTGYSQNVNIPDQNFKNYLINNSSINTDGNNEISEEEAASFTGSISVSRKEIHDLKGIEAFTALTELDCSENYITKLDLSQNIKLEWLTCRSNNLSELNVNSCTFLLSLICSDNKLESLDLGKNAFIEEIDCYNNHLSSLNISKCTDLMYIRCYNNNLTSLDLSKNLELGSCDCSQNYLSNIDLSSNSMIYSFLCGLNSLSSLDLSNNSDLDELGCVNNNNLSRIDLRNGNRLSSFDFTENPNLFCISVDENNIDFYNDNSFENIDEHATFNSDCESNYFQAIFSANYTSGEAPLSVDFINESTGGEVNSYNWDFGDGNTSTEKNPSNIYTKSGLYDVTLTIEKDEQTKASIRMNYIIVNSEDFDTFVNIPDPIFKEYLINNYDINANRDTNITYEEAAAYSDKIVVSKDTDTPESEMISDLTGVETFVNIQTLYCHNNNLTSIDISKNVALTNFSCSNNNLSSLDLSTNINLIDVSCSGNNISSLSLTNNAKLSTLSCNNNAISRLELRTSTALTSLHCNNNNLKELNLSSCTALISLICSDNKLISLNLDANKMINQLECNNNKLIGLDLSKNTSLDSFYCKKNSLSTLNMRNSNNTQLRYFDATENPFLKCISVDDVDYAINNWLDIDEQTTYNQDCRTNFLQAIFNADIVEGLAPLSVQFNNESTGVEEGGFSWEWNFGDGHTSTEQNPIHKYTAAGKYSISLSIIKDTVVDKMIRTDYIIATLTDVNSILSNFIKLYPNPTKNKLIVESAKHQDVLSIEIIDITGKTIYRTNKINSQTIEIDLISYPSGILLIKTTSQKNEITIQKIIKL